MNSKNKKSISKWIFLILVLALVVSVVINMFFIKRKEKPVILSENIEQQVKKIAEVSTIKYNYTDVVSYENSKQFSGLDIPFTNKRFIVKYNGYIKAGVDFEDIKIKVEGNNVEVIMPKAKILDNVIIEEDVAFFDEKNGLFNKLNYDELYDVLIVEKEKTQKEVISEGILEEAEENAEDLIKILLEDLGVENVKIISK